MNWLSKEKQKCWNKAYKNYKVESGFSSVQMTEWIKINPYVLLCIENKAIEYLKENYDS
tara:strand:+ start:1154 stop:1330 length:177 start_codon:yes stop_codon:yes gene_type:complete